MGIGQEGQQVRRSEIVGRVGAQGAGEVGHAFGRLIVVHALTRHLLVGAAVGLAQVLAAQFRRDPVALGFEVERRAGDAAGDDCEGDRRRRRDTDTVTPHETRDQVAAARRTGHDGLVVQEPLHVVGQFVGAGVAAVRVALQGLQHDPIDVTLDRGLDRGGLWRILLRDLAQKDVNRLLGDVGRRHQRLAADEVKQDRPERIHVRARVHVRTAMLDLLRTDVARRSHQLVHARRDGVPGAFTLQHLRDAEVDDLWDGLAVFIRHHDVSRLQVAVDDPFLMGVMHGLADRNEKGHALPHVVVVLFAVRGDGAALHQLHREKWRPHVRLAGVEHLGDVRVLHDGERLLLNREPAEDVGGGHAGLEQLDGHEAVQRLNLLRTVNQAETAFTELVQQAVAVADPAIVSCQRLQVRFGLGFPHARHGSRRGCWQSAMTVQRRRAGQGARLPARWKGDRGIFRAERHRAGVGAAGIIG